MKDEYVRRNPTLHQEDSKWKTGKIIPFIDIIIKKHYNDCLEIKLLDVGGGAGLILKAISTYIEINYNIKVSKYALDLSPTMLASQRGNNPEAKLLNEDICRTSLRDKEIDIALMIDVIEHIPNPSCALKEIERISRFAIFKVPLEDSLIFNIWDFLKRGKPRQNAIESIGHVNTYNLNSIKRQVELNGGSILDSCLTNIFAYIIKNEHYAQRRDNKTKLMNRIASHIFKISPRLCSYFFSDSLMLLVSYN